MMNRSTRTLLVLGLILLPSILFFLYVGAYHRPLDNMRNTEVLLVNMDGSQSSKEVEAAIRNTNIYQFRIATYDDALSQVSHGEAWAAVVIPSDFTERLEHRQDAQLVLIVDEQQSYIVARVISPTMSVLVSKLNNAYRESADRVLSSGLSAASSQTLNDAGTLKLLSAGASRIGQEQNAAAIGVSQASSASIVLRTAQREAAFSLRHAANGAKVLQDGVGKISDGGAQVQHGAQSIAALPLPASVIAGANQLAVGGAQIAIGADAAQYGTGVLAGSLESGSSDTHALARKTSQVVSGLAQVQDGQMQLAVASTQLGERTQLLANTQEQVASALHDAATYTRDVPGISLTIQEANKTDYGTFFATAFLVLGLFFGCSSAYLYAQLSPVKRKTSFIIGVCCTQVLVIFAVYLAMGFPCRDGMLPLFCILLLISAVFVLLVRAIVAIVTPKLEMTHLQLLSPLISLLAVFMISSGGTIWPQHTLDWPFSLFPHFIPFFYAVMGVRMDALAGAFPAMHVLYLLGFALLFLLIPIAVDRLRA